MGGSQSKRRGWRAPASVVADGGDMGRVRGSIDRDTSEAMAVIVFGVVNADPG